MVQIIPEENPWANVGKNLGQGLLQGYMQRSDENAMRDAISKLTPDATPRDVLNAVIGARTYDPNAKRQALQDYLGADRAEQLRRQAELSYAKDLQSLYANQARRASVPALLEAAGIPEEQRESLFNISPEAAEGLLKERVKRGGEQGLTPFQRKLQEKKAEEYVELTKEIPKIQSTLGDIRYARELSKDLGVLGMATSALGLSGKGRELESVAFTLIEPIVKIFNPSGPIAERKLRTIQEKYAIKATDSPWNREAKLRALERFATQALDRAQQKLELMQQYDGNPPAQALAKFDKESDVISDAIIGYDLAQAENQQKNIEEPNEITVPFQRVLLDNNTLAPKNTSQDGGLLKDLLLGSPEQIAQEFQEVQSLTSPEGQLAQSKGGLESLPELPKGLLSGATFGLTENIEALKPDATTPLSRAAAGFGRVAGSLLPFSGLTKVFGATLGRLASKTPLIGKPLSSLATMFGVGATAEGLESLAKGEVPTTEEVLERGAEWVLLDAALQAAGVGGKFAKSLLSKSNRTGVSRKDLINKTIEKLESIKSESLPKEEIGELALKSLEETNPKIDLKNIRVEQQSFDKLIKDSQSLSEASLPSDIGFVKEAAELESNVITSRLESVGAKAESEEALGTALRNDIDESLDAAKASYRPLYEKVEQDAARVLHSPRTAGPEAANRLIRIRRMHTKPSGYSAVEATLENVLKDTGYVVDVAKDGSFVVKSENPVPLSNTIELGRRLNEIIDYESVEPSVKDTLRGVVRAVKRDIRSALEGQGGTLLQDFNAAERAHAETARKFSTDTIRHMRAQQAGEKVARVATTPTGLIELKPILSSERYASIERDLLEKLYSKSHQESKKYLREIRSALSEDSRKLADDIVHSKNPHNVDLRTKLAKHGVLDDMGASLAEGTRPDKTLKMWKTPQGRKLVREAFEGSPNAKAVEDYLKRQSFNDLVASVTKDGRLNLGKFSSFMKEPKTLGLIRDAGGDEAVAFFKSLDSRVHQMQRNVDLLDKIPRVKPSGRETHGSKILERMAEKDFPAQAKLKSYREWFTETMGLNEKGVMSVFGLMKLGVPSTVTSLMSFRLMNRFLTKPKVRQAFIESSRAYHDPIKFILAIENLASFLDTEET